MKRFILLVGIAVMLTACSAAPQAMNAASDTIPTEIQPVVVAASPPATEATLSSVTSTSGASPMGIKVRPPWIPVSGTPAATPTLQSGWQTYTNPTLEVSLDHPVTWKAEEQADGASFTSPQGDLIRLQATPSASAKGTSQSTSLQCNSLINSYGLTVQACYDAGTLTYSAEFDLESSTGLTQPIILSTTDLAVLDVYRVMLDTFHPAQ